MITGIGGFAGRHLVAALRGDGEHVVGYTIEPATADAPDDPLHGVEVHIGDIRDADRLAAILHDHRPQTLYHLAAMAHVGDSWGLRRETLEVNVLGTDSVLDAASRLERPPTVLLASSGQIYGEVSPDQMPVDEDCPARPSSPYSASKACAELLARQSTASGRLNAVIVRPFNFAGPEQAPGFVCSDFARQIAAAEVAGGGTISVGNLEARRDFTDVRDVVAGFAAAVRRGKPGAAYNLSSGRGVAIQEVLDGLLAHAAVPIRVEVDPARMRPSDVPLFVGDNTRAREELGWRPQIAFDRTLLDTLEFWRRACRAREGA